MAKAKKRPVKLSDFLGRLYGDPKLLQDFRADPSGTASKAGLSPAHQAIVTSGNAKAIGHALVDEHVDAHADGQDSGPLSFGLNWIVFQTSTSDPNG